MLLWEHQDFWECVVGNLTKWPKWPKIRGKLATEICVVGRIGIKIFTPEEIQETECDQAQYVYTDCRDVRDRSHDDNHYWFFVLDWVGVWRTALRITMSMMSERNQWRRKSDFLRGI